LTFGTGEDHLARAMKHEVVFTQRRGKSSILLAVNQRKVQYNGHILHMNSLPKHINEGNIEKEIEVAVRRGRRGEQLLDDRRKTRRYYKLKQKAPDDCS